MIRKMLWMAVMLALGSTMARAEGEAGLPAAPAETPAPATAETPASGEQTPTDRIVARFMALDADASGGVSFEEYMAMVQKRAEARYQAMDANQDGEVTDQEYRAFWKSRMAKWYRLKR